MYALKGMVRALAERGRTMGNSTKKRIARVDNLVGRPLRYIGETVPSVGRLYLPDLTKPVKRPPLTKPEAAEKQAVERARVARIRAQTGFGLFDAINTPLSGIGGPKSTVGGGKGTIG